MDRDQGSWTLAIFDWTDDALRLHLLASTTIYGGIVDDQRQRTLSPQRCYRWQSRQAARQALRRLRSRLILNDQWIVLNLRSVGTE